MKIFRGGDAPFRAVDTHSFVGPAETKRLGSSDTGTPVHIYHVRFEPGGRTNWHVHSGPQWLLVTEGTIRVQCWGQSASEVTAGDAVMIDPGEKHWHGATAHARGVHLAVNVDVKTEWLEPVSEEDYGASGPAR
jgi:quercetin dioxygenase-like cupin family protein